MSNRNNTGDFNSGYGNSGYRNSGYRNSGNWNSGDLNSGDGNSGDLNSGNWNSGNWNSGDLNSGDLNTTEPKLRIFNKETDLKRGDIEYPKYFFFELTEWVQEEAMTEDEKKEYPEYETLGGYLKTLEYHEAWKKSWDKATDEDRRKTLTLPNWNNEIFSEISGIDVERELNAPETIEFNGKKYNKEEFEKRLKELEPID